MNSDLKEKEAVIKSARRYLQKLTPLLVRIVSDEFSPEDRQHKFRLSTPVGLDTHRTIFEAAALLEALKNEKKRAAFRGDKALFAKLQKEEQEYFESVGKSVLPFFNALHKEMFETKQQ